MATLSRAAVPASVVLPATLAGFADQYHAHAEVERGVLPLSAEAERPYLRRFFEWFGPPASPTALLQAINPDAIIACLIDYGSKHGPGSRRCMQKTVRLFLRFAYEAGLLQADLSALSPSVHSPRMGKVARAIPPPCIAAVLKGVVGDSPADLRDRAIFGLLSTYGVRGVQVRRLRLEDVDWARSRIYFRGVKGGRAVEHPLTAMTGNRLAEYIRHGRTACKHREVFLTARAPFEPIRHPRQLSRIIRARLEALGVKLPEGVAYGSHGFRHAFASRLYGAVPFKELVDMMGHCDPSTTLVYGKVAVATLKKAALPWPGGAQ